MSLVPVVREQTGITEQINGQEEKVNITEALNIGGPVFN